MKKFLIKKYHYFKTRINKNVVTGDHYTPMVEIEPRIPDKVWIPPANLVQRPPWEFNISVFKGYQSDNPRLLKKCFEFDWGCSRCEKICKGDVKLAKKLKEKLRSHYKLIKAGYKYYSMFG